MKSNSLINKKILGVCAREDILQTLADKIKNACPKCRFEMATTPAEARRLMILFSYHLLITDETNLKKFPRAGPSLIQNFPILILTDNGKLSSEQEISFTPNIYGYLPTNQLEKTIPILSRLLDAEFIAQWQRPFKLYGGIFNLGTVEAAEKLFKKGFGPWRPAESRLENTHKKSTNHLRDSNRLANRQFMVNV